MARLNEDSLLKIAAEMQPCEHDRYTKLSEIAHRNGVSRQTLNKLLNGRHSLSNEFHEILEKMAPKSEKKVPKKVPKRGKK